MNTNFYTLICNMPTYLIIELITYLYGVIAFYHAWSNGAKYIKIYFYSIVCGIINITVSFFNEEYWFPILSLGIISVCFGIFGYLSQPKKDSN